MRRKSRDDSEREQKDVTREPKGRMGGRKSRKDEDATTEAPEEDDLELRRNLRKGGRRESDGDSTREPKDSTAEPHERKSRDDSAREPKDVTREPKGRKGGRKSRKDEDATTEAPEDDLELRRNLRKGKRRGGRGESDSDSTKEPKDSTSEPRERKSRDDSKRESKDVTREPCDDCKDRRKRKDATTEAPEEVPALRRALKRDGGRKRRKGIDATISNGLVDIAGVTGEVVFGDVDEALESIPLTLTIGETTF